MSSRTKIPTVAGTPLRRIDQASQRRLDASRKTNGNGWFMTFTYRIGCIASVTYRIGCIASVTYRIGCIASATLLAHAALGAEGGFYSGPIGGSDIPVRHPERPQLAVGQPRRVAAVEQPLHRTQRRPPIPAHAPSRSPPRC